jgi:HAE1 family hydrophobic/amphiphilic exporter-1
MTAMISIIAMTPVAFFPKTGMDAYSPLATAVIGGLAVGTILSLLDIPILHTYADDFIQGLTRVRRRIFGMPADNTEADLLTVPAEKELETVPVHEED